jgi:hypothetical protein
MSFKVGDSLIFIDKNSIDTLPKCNSNNNLKDSIKKLKFEYIKTIEQNYFTVSQFSNYSYDSILWKERRLIKETNKQEFKCKWKDYDTVIGIDSNSNWIFVYKRTHYFEPKKVFYDSLTYLIKYSPVTECDGILKDFYRIMKFMYFPRLTKWRLYRWDVEKYKLKIKGRH